MELKKPLTLRTLLALLVLPACAFRHGLEEPSIALQPYYTLYQVEGKTSQEFQAGSNTFLGNALHMDDLGLEKRDSDYGIVASYGDGFAGLGLDYLSMSVNPTGTHVIPSNYGQLQAGDAVRSQFRMAEVRLSYLAQLFDCRPEEGEWWVRAGVGGIVSYRDISLRARDVANNRSQKNKLEGAVPFAMVQVAAGYGPASVSVMFAYNDDLATGGDFEDEFQDLEVRGSYFLEDQDLTLFAGWRRLDVGGEGTTDGLDFVLDFKITGLFLGLELRF